jgi:Protein of unknown function (DUF3443)
MIRILPFAFVVFAAVTPQCGPSTSPSAPGGTTTTTTTTQNFQTIVVNAGPANNYFNGAFTSVTVCQTGTSTCQTIDGVLVDTGSSGLRVLSSALTLSLAQQNDASGAPIAECAQFVDGFTWGPVQTADIKLGGETASAVPLQVIGAPAFTSVPAACSSTGAAEDTLATLGANGILGVGPFRQDCGGGCVTLGASNPGFYFACPASGCIATTESLTKQVQNPVWLFPTDNNGVIIQLPTVPIGGALTSSGMMIFGIGTQSDNALGSAKVLTLDGNGYLPTIYLGQTYASSYLDSGSNGIFFLDSKTTGLPLCTESTDFYCPTALTSQSATIRGINGATSAVTFNVGNVDQLNGRFSAFSEVAGPNPGGFGFGLSFFFGRTIFTAIEGQATSGGTGPYFAF